MEITQIKIELKEYIEALLSPEIEITDNSTLEDMNVDSLALVKLFVFIEKKFGVMLGEIGIRKENIATFGKISELIFDNKKD
jgi:acyl carrier protein